MFDDCYNPPSNAVSPILVVATLRSVDIADSPMSTAIDQDEPSLSISSTQEQSPIISQGAEESLKTPHFNDDPLRETLHEDSTSQRSSSNIRPSHTPFKLLGKWTKNHPIANVIRDPSRSVSIKKQLQTDTIELREVVYVSQPEQFLDPDKPNHVYRHKKDTRQSTFGIAQFLGDKLLSWSSKKQKSTAISSTEICLRLPNQEFDAPPLDEKIATFIKELRHKETPKKAMKFKKLASLSKKKAHVAVEEPVEKLVKKPATRRQLAGVQIKDTPGVSASKKKAPAKAERRKGIDFLSETALLEEAHLKKAIKRSKQKTNIHQACGSTRGANLQSKVPDEPKDKSINTSEGTDLKLKVPDVSKADSSKSEYECWGDSDDDDQQSDDERTESNDANRSVDLNKTDDEEEDEFIHTSNDTDNESVDDEEFEQINEEMYSNVNVELKESEREGKEKDDEEMNDVGPIEAEHENVNQEVAGDQVKDDAQATVTATPAIQNIETSPLLTVLVMVIPKTSSAQVTIIPSPIPPFTPLQQQSTPIPTPITTEATTSKTVIFDSTTLSAIHQRLSDLENKVKTLKNIDHSSALRATIRSEVLTIVKGYLKTNKDDALYKVLQRPTAKVIKEHSIPADVINVLKQ
nr:hypothetical protein [Tanacetum cinerariifolium]